MEKVKIISSLIYILCIPYFYALFYTEMQNWYPSIAVENRKSDKRHAITLAIIWPIGLISRVWLNWLKCWPLLHNKPFHNPWRER